MRPYNYICVILLNLTSSKKLVYCVHRDYVRTTSLDKTKKEEPCARILLAQETGNFTLQNLALLHKRRNMEIVFECI